MWKPRIGRIVVALAIGLATTTTATTARAQSETHVYGIANFGGPGECGSLGMTHPVHTSTAAAFAGVFNFLKAFGFWDEVWTRNNTSARGSYFMDVSKNPGGDDVSANFGADEPDIFYVHTHGSANSMGSSLSMGNSGFACSVHTNTDMLWGNPGSGDLEMAVVKACQSANYTAWLNGGYRASFTVPSSGFSLWNGFHGDSSCGNHVTTYVGSYAWSTLFEGAGENWIDAAYDPSRSDCPTSIVMGSTQANRRLQYEHGGWLDRKNTGAKTGSTYWFIAGCDPPGADPLPL